jgi:hypothetical protein
VARINKASTEDVAYIPVAEVLGQVLLDLQPQLEEVGAQVAVEVDGESVQFSRKSLKSILYNLLSNAAKYRSPDRQLRVKVASQVQEDYLMLVVEDNELGIDMRQEEKIFALFKRLHTHVEGTGIGLYMVKKMLENAGGKIKVESQVGVGSAFKVYFKRYGGLVIAKLEFTRRNGHLEKSRIASINANGKPKLVERIEAGNLLPGDIHLPKDALRCVPLGSAFPASHACFGGIADKKQVPPIGST